MGNPAAGCFVPGPETTRDFRHALGQFATGVAVVTTTGADGPVGMTINSFASLSLDPPLVLWSPAKASARYPAFRDAGHFSIHILAQDQETVARGFARGPSPFARAAPELSANGCPVLAGCAARFDCSRWGNHDGGDHRIIIGRVDRAHCTGRDPLVFMNGCYGKFTA